MNILFSMERPSNKELSLPRLSRSDKANDSALTVLLDKKLFSRFEYICGWLGNLITFSFYHYSIALFKLNWFTSQPILPIPNNASMLSHFNLFHHYVFVRFVLENIVSFLASVNDKINKISIIWKILLSSGLKNTYAV